MIGKVKNSKLISLKQKQLINKLPKQIKFKIKSY